jgi:hypothetical protein
LLYFSRPVEREAVRDLLTALAILGAAAIAAKAQQEKK